MPGDQSFSTIAEVAIAFLGFTGVVGVFSGQDHPPAVSMRLWVMVEFGLALLLLSLLPLVLHHLGLSSGSLWLTCSASTILFLIGHLVFVVPRIVRHMRAGTWGDVPAMLNLNRPGFPGDSISWENGVHGKQKPVFTGGPRAGRADGAHPRGRA